MAKIVDLKTTPYIPKKYHYLINWEMTYFCGIEKDADGYWIYLKSELGADPKGRHTIHEPLKYIKYYLAEADEQVKTIGKYELNY